MPPIPTLVAEPAGGARFRQEALGWVGGLGFTLALFLGLAHYENIGTEPAALEFTDLRAVPLPLETPPPPPLIEPVLLPEPPLPLTGIDAGPSDSTLRIVVVPPELESLLPTTREPPKARIQPGYVHTELKPRMDIEADVRRIYQVSEVDQPPQAIVRVAPAVPVELYGDARFLRIMLLVVINADGSVGSARVARSSGQPVFDAAAVEAVKTLWEFTPAIRRGKKVKCLAQQAFRVNLPGASPYELP